MINEGEKIIARAAEDFSLAYQELNPYSEAEVLNLGCAKAVYCGVHSQIHGVYALGLDSPVEERDIKEIERFFRHKDRAPIYWTCSKTDPSLLHHLNKAAIKQTQIISSKKLTEITCSLNTEINYLVDPLDEEEKWIKLAKNYFTELDATILWQQKNTKIFLNENQVSYSYFYEKNCLIPNYDKNIFFQQCEDAKKLLCHRIFQFGVNPFFTEQYERIAYEQI